MLEFGIFYILRLMGIYRVGPVRVFEKFRSLFSFLHFLFFVFSFSLLLFIFFTLGAPFSSGAPGHRPPTATQSLRHWAGMSQQYLVNGHCTAH